MNALVQVQVKVGESLCYLYRMIKIAIVLFCLTCFMFCQDAVLTPTDPFFLQLRESATYHQSFLIEIDPHSYNSEWSSVYAHQSAYGHSVVDLQFNVVHKQYPEKHGHVLAKCRLEDQSRRWCKVDPQGINLHHHLIKLKLDCVSDCSGNITVGFAHSQWDGQDVPKVQGAPLETNQLGNSEEGNKKLFKIIGWMVLTLVLVLLAIQLGQKIATKFDARMQEERMEGLRQKRIPTQATQTHKKTQ